MWSTTMPKNAYLNARVDKRTKARAQKVLSSLGMSTTDAINLFLHQIVLHEGLPFEVRVPNKETREAIAETRAGGGRRHRGTTRAIFDQILAEPASDD